MKVIRPKYDIRICTCGRIHVLPIEKLDKALAEEKNLIFICKKCGMSLIIGGDYIKDSEYDLDGYNMYSSEMMEDVNIINKESFENTDNHKGISEIILDKGYPVPMNNGSNANSYSNGRFYDYSRPDFNAWYFKENEKPKEIFKAINNFITESSTVNMKQLIRLLPDDILKELSRFVIDGLNWKGTKWETEWNSR